MNYDVGTELVLKGLDESHANTARVLLSDLDLRPGNTISKMGNVVKKNIVNRNNVTTKRDISMGDNKDGDWEAVVITEDQSDNSVNVVRYTDSKTSEHGDSLVKASIDGKLTTPEGIYFYTCRTLRGSKGTQSTYNPEKERWESTADCFITNVIFYDKQVVNFLQEIGSNLLGDMEHTKYQEVKSSLKQLGILPDGETTIGYGKSPAAIANAFAKEGNKVLVQAIEQAKQLNDHKEYTK